MSILLPHFLNDGRGKLEVYFTRVFNPIWTYPDGFTWMRALTDEDKVGLHVALTPTWSETAEFADYVLPMGHSPERHDTHSYETHAAKWLGFRQPVRRVAMERLGRPVGDTREANPGEVWEENEFWFELSWRIDPDGSLGIRQYFESPYRPGEKVTVDEYYRWIFENQVPGLPEKAAARGMTPLEYMRRYGVVEVATTSTARTSARSPTSSSTARRPTRTACCASRPTCDSVPPLIGEAGAVGVQLDDGSGRRLAHPVPQARGLLHRPCATGAGRSTPRPATSAPRRRRRDRPRRRRVRPGAHVPAADADPHPVGQRQVPQRALQHPPAVAQRARRRTARRASGDLVRLNTAIGYFVARVWVTEGIRPGVCALSHHMGRWRLHDNEGSRWVQGLVDIAHPDGPDSWLLRYRGGIEPFASDDPDSARIWWTDPGVHQNLAFPVQPDPRSGMHCWLQKVRMEKAHPGDRYGDVYVDARRSTAVYREWLAKTRADARSRRSAAAGVPHAAGQAAAPGVPGDGEPDGRCA